MFSTHDGAKKAAKKLKKTFDESGFDYPLNRCQTAIARAGGYQSWNDLEGSLVGAAAPRAVDADAYIRRLVRALPDPCIPGALAVAENQPREPYAEHPTPPYWWQDVFPYLFAIAVIHRATTPILRPGSGLGQKLREHLVVGLLTNRHGGRQVMPTLDPETLALTYRADLEALFGADSAHPRFDVEMAALEAAGVIERIPNGVRILAPDREAVGEHVLSSMIGKAGDLVSSSSSKEALEMLGAALSAIGVTQALRVADAIMQHGSAEFDRPSGTALELLSSFAEEGDIVAFSKAVRLFEALFPHSKRQIRSSVPAKLSSLYLARHRGLGAGRQMAYMNANPDWADNLRNGAADPSRLSATVNAIAAAMEAV